jgi:hypothetical protein
LLLATENYDVYRLIAYNHQKTIVSYFMKKIIQFRWAAWLSSINAAIVVLASGCATPQQHSFNQDFGENLPTKPCYYIYDEDERYFRINVHQGTSSTGAERLIDVKEAASTIAKAECQRLGWKKWQLNYIQESDRGWMRVVIAEVTREKYVEPTFPQSSGNP